MCVCVWGGIIITIFLSRQIKCIRSARTCLVQLTSNWSHSNPNIVKLHVRVLIYLLETLFFKLCNLFFLLLFNKQFGKTRGNSSKMEICYHLLQLSLQTLTAYFVTIPQMVSKTVLLNAFCCQVLR